MKSIEKKKAIALREKGESIKEISKKLGVAKSSVSIWVRHVELSDNQIDYLKKKGLFREKIERSRQTRLRNEKNNLPYGTLDIYVYDTQLFYKITGWASGISYKLLNESLGSFSSGEKI